MGSVDKAGDEVATFLAEVRAAYVSDPEEAVASRHLAAIAREAELVRTRRAPTPSAWRRTMNRNRFLRPVVTLTAATLAVALGTAGLAVAGVDLPDPADDAFERVGIDLPNQAGGGQSGEHSRSDAVRDVIETTPPSERGCEFGHRVAEAAKGSALPENAQDACDRANEARRGKGAQGTNSNRSQFGRDTAAKAKDLGGATAEDRRSFGEDTADRAQELGGAPDQAPAAEQRRESAPVDGTTAAPEGTPDGPPDAAPIPDGTPTGPPDGTPGGRP
jgi:hypothetical protein